jgi:general secretion pathway protein D
MITEIETIKTTPSLKVPAATRAVAAAGNPGLHPGARIPVRGQLFLLMALLTLGGLPATAQNETPPPVPPPETAGVTNPPAIEAPMPVPAVTGSTNAMDSSMANPVSVADESASAGSSTNGLRLNFRNVPIDLVLNYLSEAAGFIIELDTGVRGNVSVISSHPMTKDEAVDLLNSVLNRNGYAAIRSGERTLKIMDKAAAKSSNPVRIGNEPGSIPNNDEMVTQIIPIRYVEASQLVSDISPFVSSGATIIANQAGNSIIITDTQANIRHLVEIIKAIDSSAEDVTEVKVFHLRYADPSEMATLLAGLFPDQNGAAQAPIRFGNRGGGGGFGGGRGGFGGGGGFNPFAAAFGGGGNASTGNSQNDRIKKRNQVVAVADARTSSVVVTATKDLMEQITEMVDQLDNPGKAQHMEVIHINNSDPSEVLSVLQDTVGASSSRNSRSTQSSPFQTRIQQSQSGSSSSTATGRNSLGNNSSMGRSQGGGNF